MTRALLTAIAVVTTAISAAVAATPPTTVSYQGVLRSASGVPLDGSYDMVFAFYSHATLGDPLLTDTHDAVSSQPVQVNGGLFNVDLGGGLVLPGSEFYLRLDEIFRDFGEAWMEIHVDGETLLPRVKIHASPYAHNATNLGGRGENGFLNTSSEAQQKTGDLTVNGWSTAGAFRLSAGGTIQSWIDGGGTGTALNGGGSSGNGLILKANSGDYSPRIELRPAANLELLSDGGFQFKSTVTESLLMHLDFSGNLQFDGDLDLGSLNQDVNINFGDNGRLLWDESQDRLEFDRRLAINGPLRIGTDAGTAQSYSFVGPAGSIGPASSAMNASNDFYVAGDLEAQTYHGDRFEATATFDLNGTDNHFNTASQHRVMIDSDNSTTGNFAAWYHDGGYATTQMLAKIQESGNLQLAGVLQENVAFDIAESFLAMEPLEPGDLVRIDPGRVDGVRKTTGENDRTVIGVISSRPGVLLGGAPFSVEALRQTWGDVMADDFLDALPQLKEELTALHPEMAEVEEDLIGMALEAYWEWNVVPVALSGRVPVKVDGSYGTIEAGDYLAPSPIPGVAMKATSPGPVIGTALEPLAEGGRIVTAFIHRGHYGGENTADPVQPVQEPFAIEELVARAMANLTPQPSESPETFANDPEESVMNTYVPFGALLESMPATGSIRPGQVVVMDRERPGSIMPAALAGDTAVVGIAVDPAGLEVPAGQVALALAGIVDVQADAGYGSIEVGDAVVTSHTTGCVMRDVDPAPMTVVGKALTGLESGTGTIQVLLMMR